MIQSVGVIYNHRIAEAIALSEQIQKAMQDLSRDVWLLEARQLDDPELHLPPADLLITLGGDGTILRAARLSAVRHALVLGVNMGQLGFLAEMEPGDILAKIPEIVAGNGWIEERMMLRATLPGKPANRGPIDGLNDVVVTRGARPRAVRVGVDVNGCHIQTYVCDGVIVSTPTGSTAYALSMDGPIVFPEMRSMQITPIAAHLAVVKSMVVPATALITLTVHSKEPSLASVDGQIDIPLSDGDKIDVTAGPNVARFVRLQDRSYFCKSLVSRLSSTIVRGLI
jgi:NAD+ kinase